MGEQYSPAAAATLTDSDIQAAEQLMELSNSDGAGTTLAFSAGESSSAGSVNLAGNVNKRNKTAEEKTAAKEEEEEEEEEEMVSRLLRRRKQRKWRSLESIYSSTVPIS